jgi:hypothetical protein
MQRSRQLTTWITAAALLAIGLIVRAAGLGAQWFSPDDLLHLEIAAGPGIDGVWRNAADQMHPPLVFFLLHACEQLTLDAGFFRFLPLLPGLLLIAILFLFGRAACDSVAGLAMAGLCALSYGAIVLAQVIRPYSLLAVLITGALWGFVAWSRSRRPAALWAYGLCMAAALALHYSAALQLSAIVAVWVLRALCRRDLRAELRWLAAANVPLFALLATLWFVHGRWLSGLYAAVQESYLAPFFPATLGQLGRTIQSYFGFHSLDRTWWLGAALFVVGVGALASRQRTLCALVVVTFAQNLVLTWLGRYPFGGLRQAMYLLPVTALAIGATASLAAGGLRRAIGARWLAPAAAAAALLGAGAIALHHARYDFLRRHPNAGNYSGAEFPLRRADYEAAMAFLDSAVRPGDAILVNRQTGHYFRFLTGYRQGTYLTYLDPGIVPLDVGRLRVSVAPQLLFFGDENELLRGLRKLSRTIDLAATPRVWIVNFGWDRPVEQVRLSSSIFAPLLQRGFLARGASVHAIDGAAALAEIERRR